MVCEYPPRLLLEVQVTDHNHIGTDPSRPTLVAIKGVVFDVTRNPAYGPNGSYRGRFLPEMPQMEFPVCMLMISLFTSLRRQRPLTRSGLFLTEARRLRT